MAPLNSVVLAGSQKVLTYLIEGIYLHSNLLRMSERGVDGLPVLECQSDGVEASGLFTCNTCGVGSQRPIEETLAPFESQLCKEPWRMRDQEARINIELSF